MAWNSEIRVLVADDEPLARRGVRQLLAPHRDMTVVGEARNGTETVRALDELSPDLLFLDVQMPEMDGFEVLRAHGVDRMPLWCSSQHTISSQYAIPASNPETHQRWHLREREEPAASEVLADASPDVLNSL